jgi:hypothetical protein
MNIWVISDLHLEFGERFDIEPPPNADVMVCAGDILIKGVVPSLSWLTKNIARKIPVVLVAGNHEFYGASVVESLQDAKIAGGSPDLHFLENDTVRIDGVLFIGGTLWTDFRLFGRDPKVAMSYASSDMNDYKKIKLSKMPYSKFRRSWSSSYAIRLRPHRSGRADFPHPALPESNPRHLLACAQVRVIRGTGSAKRAVRISNSNQLIRRLF